MFRVVAGRVGGGEEVVDEDGAGAVPHESDVLRSLPFGTQATEPLQEQAAAPSSPATFWKVSDVSCFIANQTPAPMLAKYSSRRISSTVLTYTPWSRRSRTSRPPV